MNGNNAADNCRLEFMHAARVKTSTNIIVVVMENRMLDTNKWKGVIGMYLAGKLYVDLSEDLNDIDLIKERMRMLCNELKGIGIVPAIEGKHNISIQNNMFLFQNFWVEWANEYHCF